MLISPLLSNIFLHYVLEVWFKDQIQPLLRGTSFIIRFADDFLMGFTHKEDAERVIKVLPKRFAKYGLILHPDKTHLAKLDEGQDKGGKTFDFLGFTHYMGTSRKGIRVLKRKTSKKKLRLALIKMNDWLRSNRHKPVKWLISTLNVKLRGYYGYYGITFNFRQMMVYYLKVKRMLHKWLNRRGGKASWIWGRYSKLVEVYMPLLKPKIYHSYQLAKP